MRGVKAALTELDKTPNLDKEDKPSRRVLAALACAGAVPLEPEQCAAIAQVDGVQDVLANLVRRGLVQHVVPGFRLAAGLAPQVEATPEFAACRERATAVFSRFAFEARGTPRRVARLAAPMTASMAWAAENGHSEEALRLARAIDGPLADSNRWDAWHDMLTRAHDIAVRAGDMSTAGWALHQQGTRAVLLGDKQEGRRLLREARSTRTGIGDVAGLKATRNNLKFLGWTRWMVLLAVLAGLGVTTLGAIVVAPWIIPTRVAIVPERVDFGAQDVRGAAQQKPLRVDNKGLGAVDVINVTLQGSDAKSFAVGTSCDGIRIPRALACQLLVQFKPDSVGAREATIAIRVRDVKDPYLVTVHGLGTATPIAMLSTQNVDFGAVEIGGGAESRTVTLRNTGSAPLVATAIAIDGDGDFRIVRESCKAAAIAPEVQCAIDLRFSPHEANAKRATLVISDNASGSPRIVTLSGTGHATPKLEVAPGNLDFGRQEIGTQSAVRSVRLRNSGTAPVEIQQVTLEGSNAFRVQGNCANVKLAPGAACGLELRFAPSAIEASNGRVVIANSAGSARGVDLAGTGFGQPAISVAPAKLDFGVFKRGAAVRPQRVTITSAGKAALSLRPPSISGDTRFSLVNDCPEQLAPNAQCSLDVGFDASGTGKAGASLVVRHNAAGGPAVVTLSAGIESIPPPVIERFESNPQVLERRGNVQLCFRVQNAQQLAIEPPGPQPQSNSVGCVTRLVGDTTTFRLTASGEGGPSRQVSSTLTVRVAPPQAPVIVFLRADPPSLQGTGVTRLCFAARNAEGATIAPGGPQPQSPSEGCVSRRLSTTTTFTLTASRSGAPSQTRDVTVAVIPFVESGKRPPAGIPKGEPPKQPPAGTPKGEPPKGEGVIVKDGVVKKMPGAPGAAVLVGWCCRLGTVTRVQASSCPAPGQWFATEAPANRACGPPVVR